VALCKYCSIGFSKVIAVSANQIFAQNCKNMSLEDRRKMIQHLLDAGKSTTEIRAALVVSRTAIFRVRQMLQATGGVRKRSGAGRKRSKQVIRAVKQKILRNPRRSMRKLAKEHRMSPRTMRRLVRDDLGMKSKDGAKSKNFPSF
jgi:transposase-like protein